MNTKVYNAVMGGNADNNIRFDLRNLLDSVGFKETIRGDHHIYKRKDIPERINIQPVGNKSKAIK